ncbi:UvrABC system C protein, putative [Actinidia rufa]|uniref:UvrABC system C protein, putative n=1 Tax=Actinidia rufa TaxID=165716 RepID=A0A7J0GQE6_9ERIC|nr:UvrABC system C protein, putative [Actinidia rufa]
MGVTPAVEAEAEAEAAVVERERGEKKDRGFDAILTLAEVGRSLDSLPKDLAAAIEAGRIPGSIVVKYLELEKSPLFRWLLQFGGFRERLLADDLFLFKVFMECGVGIFTKDNEMVDKVKECYRDGSEAV